MLSTAGSLPLCSNPLGRRNLNIDRSTDRLTLELRAPAILFAVCNTSELSLTLTMLRLHEPYLAPSLSSFTTLQSSSSPRWHITAPQNNTADSKTYKKNVNTRVNNILLLDSDESLSFHGIITYVYVLSHLYFPSHSYNVCS